MTPSKKSWNARLRDLRSSLGVSQPALAEKLGITRVWLSYLENDQREVSELIQLKIAQLEKVNAVDRAETIVGFGVTDELKEFSWRLQTAMNAAQVDAATVAGRLGVPAERVTDEWIKGIRKPRAREGRDLAIFLDVLEPWLMRGEGNQSDLVVVDEADDPPPGAIPIRHVPVISWTHAGQAATFEEMPKHWQGHVPSTSRDRKAFGVIVEGDCMEPKYLPGDTLIVEPSRERRNGKPVVAKLADDAVQVRIYTKMPNGQIHLTSLKPDLHPAIVATERDFHWIWPVHSMVRTE